MKLDVHEMIADKVNTTVGGNQKNRAWKRLKLATKLEVVLACEGHGRRGNYDVHMNT